MRLTGHLTWHPQACSPPPSPAPQLHLRSSHKRQAPWEPCAWFHVSPMNRFVQHHNKNKNTPQYQNMLLRLEATQILELLSVISRPGLSFAAVVISLLPWTKEPARATLLTSKWWHYITNAWLSKYTAREGGGGGGDWGTLAREWQKDTCGLSDCRVQWHTPGDLYSPPSGRVPTACLILVVLLVSRDTHAESMRIVRWSKPSMLSAKDRRAFTPGHRFWFFVPGRIFWVLTPTCQFRTLLYALLGQGISSLTN